MRLITGELLEGMGFIPAADRPLAWLLMLPDDARPQSTSYLQMVAPTYAFGQQWTAELVNVIEGEWHACAVPRPIRTEGQVMSLVTALSGQTYSIHQIAAATA